VTAPNHVRSLTELFSPESSSPPPKVNREHQLVYPLMARAIRIGGKRTPQSRIPVPPVVHFSNDPNTEPTGTANNAARRQLLNHSDDPETRHATSRRQHATPRRNFAIPAGQRIEAARPKTKTRRLESPPIRLGSRGAKGGNEADRIQTARAGGGRGGFGGSGEPVRAGVGGGARGRAASIPPRRRGEARMKARHLNYRRGVGGEGSRRG
jgi:hypothetical protein